MAKVLYIEASPRGEASRSAAVASSFINAYLARNEEDEVEIINVFDANLPEFGREGASKKLAHIVDLMTGGKGLSEEYGEWADAVSLIQRFKSADKYIISCPMWNFSIPYKLKHFFDLICQPALTFYVKAQDEYVGMIKNKPVQLILSRGSAYQSEFPTVDDGVKSDFQTSYLKHVLRFIGFDSISTLLLEPTDADPKGLEARLADWHAEAKALAEAF